MAPASERACSVVPLRDVDIMEISFNSNEDICSFQTGHLPRIQIESSRLSPFGVDIAEISSNSGGDMWRFQKDYWSRLQIESARLSPFVVDIVEISSNSDESILSFKKEKGKPLQPAYLRGGAKRHPGYLCRHPAKNCDVHLSLCQEKNI